MKKICAVLTALALFAALAGCSSDISTFTMPVANTPSLFDPQTAYKSEDLTVINNIFDGLFEKSSDKTEKSLAELYTVSGDGRRYTITIKEDAVYHYRGDNDKKDEYDGLPVTARDFVFALQRTLSPGTGSPYAEDFLNIKNASAVLAGAPAESLGVKAQDERTLIIDLENPDENFIDKLCLPAAFPCNEKFFESTGGAYGLGVENILSNGPFRLNYLDEEDGNATIVRADGVKGGVDRIRIKTITPREQAEEYKAGNISGFFDGNNPDESYPGTSRLTFESANICLVINDKNEFLSDLDTRRALAWYCFGFENSGANMEVVKGRTSLFPEDMTFAGGYVNRTVGPHRPSYLSSSPPRPASRTAGASVTLLLPKGDIYSIIYENINQLWQRDLGLFFKTEYATEEEIYEKIASEDYDIAIIPLSGNGGSPIDLLSLFCKRDDETDSLIRRAQSASGEKSAVNSVKFARQSIIEKVYAVPMASKKTTFYYSDDFSGIIADPFTKTVNLKRAVG